MKIELRDYDGYTKIGDLDETDIIETGQAEPTSRVLDGSSDHGYIEEWVRYGHLKDGRNIKTVYLFDEDDLKDEDGNDLYEDAGDYPWDTGLEQGRVVLTD